LVALRQESLTSSMYSPGHYQINYREGAMLIKGRW
jgi:hypothetical protein